MSGATLSREERALAISALGYSIRALRQNVRDTEILSPAQRCCPTDEPEMWRKELAEHEALQNRLLLDPQSLTRSTHR